MTTDDARDLAAIALRRLAREMRAVAAIGAQRPAALVGDYERAKATLAETRREAVHALGRLGESFPVDSTGGEAECPRNSAWAQSALVAHNATADELGRWATAWLALP